MSMGCECADVKPGQKDAAPAAAAGYTPPAVVGGKAEDSANEHDDKSEASDKALSRSESTEPSPLTPSQATAKALEKGKGKMVQGRRTDSASSLRCAQPAGMCRHTL